MELWLQLALCGMAALLLTRRMAAARRFRAPQMIANPAQVSIIVPARNEAHNLAILLPSLRALSPAPREIIVVDDHSTDDTARVAREHGARVIASEALPQGFIGKPWACLQGARVASGDFLLFTDADTWHAPQSLSRALSALLEDNADLLSIVPTHRLVAVWEKLQGVFQVLLLMATAAGTRSRYGKRRFAIGQYLLVRRRSYERVGGHAALGSYIAEDLAMAELFTARGMRVRLLFDPGALLVRMYPEGLRAFFAGWRRNFREGIGSAGLLAGLEITCTIGALLGIPLWLLIALSEGALAKVTLWGCAYVLCALLVHSAQRSLGAFRFWSALLYPLFTLAFVWVSLCSVWDAMRGKQVVWRGRVIEAAHLRATVERHH